MNISEDYIDYTNYIHFGEYLEAIILSIYIYEDYIDYTNYTKGPGH